MSVVRPFRFILGGKDVTEFVMNEFSNGECVDVPRGTFAPIDIAKSNIQPLFVIDSALGTRSSVVPGTAIRINLERRPIRSIEVVYFIACSMSANWRAFLAANLGYLEPLKGRVSFRLHVCANVCHEAQAFELKREVRALGYDPNFEFCYENCYEWVGIDTVYRVGKNSQGSVVLYYHSKGISHVDSDPRFMYRAPSTPGAPVGLADVFDRVLEIMYVFETFESVMRVAPWISNSGKGWHNFWWARSDYLASLGAVKRVRERRERYYYERWLGRGLANDESSQDYWRSISSEGYNLDARKPNIGAFFHPDETLGPLRGGVDALRMT